MSSSSNSGLIYRDNINSKDMFAPHELAREFADDTAVTMNHRKLLLKVQNPELTNKLLDDASLLMGGVGLTFGGSVVRRRMQDMQNLTGTQSASEANSNSNTTKNDSKSTIACCWNPSWCLRRLCCC